MRREWGGRCSIFSRWLELGLGLGLLGDAANVRSQVLLLANCGIIITHSSSDSMLFIMPSAPTGRSTRSVWWWWFRVRSGQPNLSETRRGPTASRTSRPPTRPIRRRQRRSLADTPTSPNSLPSHINREVCFLLQNPSNDAITIAIATQDHRRGVSF